MDSMDEKFENERIVQVDLEKEMKKSFLDYSMSVIVSRALPEDVYKRQLYYLLILYTTIYDLQLTAPKIH